MVYSRNMQLPKYRHFYQLMIERNAEIFKKFTQIHEGFSQNPADWADQFHTVGRDVLDVIRDWERRLCFGTEKGKYAQFSTQLAEKFWSEVKKEYPLIMQVGLVRKK